MPHMNHVETPVDFPKTLTKTQFFDENVAGVIDAWQPYVGLADGKRGQHQEAEMLEQKLS